MNEKQPPDLEALTVLIKAKSKNTVWRFSLEVENLNYQLRCTALTDIGGRDMQVVRFISDREIEDNQYGWTRLAEFIVEDVARAFARTLFLAEATV